LSLRKCIIRNSNRTPLPTTSYEKPLLETTCWFWVTHYSCGHTVCSNEVVECIAKKEAKKHPRIEPEPQGHYVYNPEKLDNLRFSLPVLEYASMNSRETGHRGRNVQSVWLKRREQKQRMHTIKHVIKIMDKRSWWRFLRLDGAASCKICMKGRWKYFFFREVLHFCVSYHVPISR
jgi:hypothetical protein